MIKLSYGSSLNIVLLYVLSSLLHICDGFISQSALYSISHNTQNNASWIQSSTAESLIECQVMCTNSEDCQASNFASENGQCDLFGVSELQFEDAVGWKYMHLDLNECLTEGNESFCVHGTCDDLSIGFLCSCDAGYSGQLCDEIIVCSETFGLIDDATHGVADSSLSESTGSLDPISDMRLDSSGGWTGVAGGWVQVDLGVMRIVTEVLTQTYFNDILGRVTRFYLSIGVDVDSLDTLEDQFGVILFDGNVEADASITARNVFVEPFVARVVRLHVSETGVVGGLRWELLGCPAH